MASQLDSLSLLTDNLTSLNIERKSQDISHFHLFSNLPAELRSKIWEHALPVPSTLKVTTDVLVCDPSFGLYLTFQIAMTGPLHNHLGYPVEKGPEQSVIESRSLVLLCTCRESREVYRLHFSIVLPIGPRARGKLYISPRETLYWDKFAASHGQPMSEVLVALRDDYKLQDWWEHIERLAISVSYFDVNLGGIYLLCLRMRKLKRLEAVFWLWFRENVTESNRKIFETNVNGYLNNVKKALEIYKGDHHDYCVPEFAIAY